MGTPCLGCMSGIGIAKPDRLPCEHLVQQHSRSPCTHPCPQQAVPGGGWKVAALQRGQSMAPQPPEFWAAGKKPGWFLGELGNDISLSSLLAPCLEIRVPGLSTTGTGMHWWSWSNVRWGVKKPHGPPGHAAAVGTDCNCISLQHCKSSGRNPGLCGEGLAFH